MRMDVERESFHRAFSVGHGISKFPGGERAGIENNLAGVADAVSVLEELLYDIHEHSDAFQLDITMTLKATELGVELRYEGGKL